MDVYSRVAGGSADAGVLPAQAWTHNAGGVLAPGVRAAESSALAGSGGAPAGFDGASAGSNGASAGSDGASAGSDGASAGSDGASAGSDGASSGIGRRARRVGSGARRRAVAAGGGGGGAVGDLYERLAAAGFDYGPAFQCLRAVWRREEELFAEVSLSEEQREQAGRFGLHPALLDAALHALLASPLGEMPVEEAGGPPRLPFSWSEVSLGAVGASLLRVRLSATGGGGVSLQAVDGAGEGVLSAGSLALRPVSAEQLGGMRDARHQAAVRRVGAGLRRGAARRWSATCCAERATDGAAGVHTCTQETLTFVQEWLADQRSADARLVIVSTGAVAVGAHEDVPTWVRPRRGAWCARRSRSTPDASCWSTSTASRPRGRRWRRRRAAGEPQVAIRGGALLAPRLVPVGSTGALSCPQGASRWRLDAGGGGTLEDLALIACPAGGRPAGARAGAGRGARGGPELPRRADRAGHVSRGGERRRRGRGRGARGRRGRRTISSRAIA